MKDVPYKSSDNLTSYERARCRLDIHRPSDPSQATNAPVLIFFHGGGLMEGDKASAGTLTALLNPHGVVVVGVNHRMSPHVKYPEYLRDCSAAIGWVKRNVGRYGGEPGRIFVSGHSAGGYLTMMLALGPGFLKDEGVSLSDLAGLIPIGGQMVTHSTVRAERGIPRSVMIVDEASPLQHVRKIDPAVLLICGDHDMPARREENLLMQAWLKAAENTDVTFLCVPNRTHTQVYDQCAEPDDPAGRAIVDFIRKHATAPEGVG